MTENYKIMIKKMRKYFKGLSATTVAREDLKQCCLQGLVHCSGEVLAKLMLTTWARVDFRMEGAGQTVEGGIKKMGVAISESRVYSC